MTNLIVEEARAWLGTPWVHQGRTKGIGVDCAGLVIRVAHGCGLSQFDMADYDRLPDGESLLRVCDEQLIRVGEMQLGDVVVMQFNRHPQHVGIVGDYCWGGWSLIHAHAQSGKVVEHRLDRNWLQKIVALYRYPGL